MEHRDFQLTYEDTGVYLEIYAFVEVTDELFAELIGHLTRKRVANLDYEALRTLLKNPGEQVQVAPPQEEVLLDETLDVQIEKGSMKAYIVLQPPDGGKHLTEEEILGKLEAACITYGIHYDLVRDIAENTKKIYNLPLEIAIGLEPVRGEDAWIEYTFRLIHNKTPRMLDDGNVDHKTLDLYDTVEKGDVLAILHPPTAGIPGCNVLGQELPPQPGKTLPLPLGKNTKPSQDQLQVLAAVSGRVELENKRVIVKRVLEIHGDVDASVGNIQFLGDVLIHGSVLSSYSITATGNIDICGVVESTRVKAGGNLVIRQGVKGKSESKISAYGDITAKFIEYATVFSGGTVRADVIMHSTVSSNNAIIAHGRRGLIIGGFTRGAYHVVADSIGAVKGAKTVVQAGVMPDVQQRLELTIAEVKLLYNDLKRKSQQIPLQQRRGAPPENISVLQHHIEHIEETIRYKENDIRKLQALVEETTAGQIHIRGTIQPRIKIEIGASAFTVPHAFEFITFYRHDKTIEMKDFSFRAN